MRVLLDNVLAERRKKTIDGFTVQPDSVATSHYVGVLAPSNAAVRDRADEVLRAAMRDGTLERIFRKWDVWNDDQPELYRQVLAGEPIAPITGPGFEDAAAHRSKWTIALAYLPALLRASVVTLCCRASRWGSRSRSAS